MGGDNSLDDIMGGVRQFCYENKNDSLILHGNRKAIAERLNKYPDIKYRFSDQIIKDLLVLKWWNWDRDVIKNNLNLFQSEITKETIVKLKKIASN